MNAGAGRATRVIFDRELNRAAVKVQPGQYFVCADDRAIVTVLGSCVAACLRDPATGIGGMNHFMLPGVEGRLPAGADALRYGTRAMEVLIEEMITAGAQRASLVAKVFGGARLIGSADAAGVGARNAGFVCEDLARRGIVIVAADLRGAWGRRLAFFPSSGLVLIKRVHMGREATSNVLDGDGEPPLDGAPLTRL